MTGTDPVLAGLCAQFEAKYSQGQKLIGKLGATGPELTQAKAYFDDCEVLQKQIDERQVLVDQAAELKTAGESLEAWRNEPQYTIPVAGKGDSRSGAGRSFRIDTGKSEIDKLESTGGFSGLGEFAFCQYKMGRDGRSGESWMVEKVKRWDGLQSKMRAWDLQQKSPSGMFEQSDPDGGVLIPRDFSNQIYVRMVAKNLILQHLTPIPISGNTLTIPALKEDSRVDGLRGGGILGYWDGEANQYTPSKTRYRDVNLRLHKLTVFTFCTDELVNDSPIALQTFLLDKAPAEINFKINDGVINGNGVGMPLGIMNSNSLITIPAVSGQGTGTFTYANVLAMFARIVAGQRGSLIWLYNQNVEPQLFGMFVATGTAAGVLVFTPNAEQPGGFKLMGRPALVMEQAQPLGTAGDVIAFAPEGYVCITKGGIESFMSIHLRFDFDETAFKWRFRFDGQPYDNVPLTPYLGTTTVSSMNVLSSTRT
jgi:HK97 family phage major capsid protein